MGDYSYLVSIEKENLNAEYSRQDILFAGKYSIPLLWFSIFNESSIVERMIDNSLYDILLISKEKGVPLAEKRKKYLLTLFEENIEKEYDRWLDCLRRVASDNYLMLDVLDLQGCLGRDVDVKVAQCVHYWGDKDEEEFMKILSYSSIPYNRSVHKAYFKPKMDEKYTPFLLMGDELMTK